MRTSPRRGEAIQDPRPYLHDLVTEGRGLVEMYSKAVPSRRAQSQTVDFGTRILSAAFDAPGLRSRIAKGVGHALISSNVAQRQAELERSFRQWQYRTKSFLNTISVAKTNLSSHGNSAQLVGRFSTAAKGAKPQTRLNTAIRFLESLHGQQLVYNGDIVELLKQRAEAQAQDAKLKAELRLIDIPEIAPGFDHLKFPNRAALAARFAKFEEERAILESALNAFLGDGPDRFRQSLGSCRIALEGMGRRVTGQDRWRDAIAKVADDATRKIFRDVWDLLCAKGSHHGKPPSKSEAEFGIQQTISCLLWLMNHAPLFRTPEQVA